MLILLFFDIIIIVCGMFTNYDTEIFAETNNEINILIASHSNAFKVSWKLA